MYWRIKLPWWRDFNLSFGGNSKFIFEEEIKASIGIEWWNKR